MSKMSSQDVYGYTPATLSFFTSHTHDDVVTGSRATPSAVKKSGAKAKGYILFASCGCVIKRHAGLTFVFLFLHSLLLAVVANGNCLSTAPATVFDALSNEATDPSFMTELCTRYSFKRNKKGWPADDDKKILLKTSQWEGVTRSVS